MKVKSIISLLTLLSVSFSPLYAEENASCNGDCKKSNVKNYPHVDVFKPGDYNSKYYRIPGIVTAKDGSLVAVADKRIEHNGDLPARIDVVARRSTDGGQTWSDYVTVMEHDSIGGAGDPAIIVDEKTGDILTIYSHGNGLWQDSPAQITVSRSSDNGLTWGAPLNINPQILTTDPNGKQPLKLTSAFASSGRALQLADGRIMFALVTRNEGEHDFPVYAVYSDDGGYTWNVSETPGTIDGDESKIVELADGTLIMSIRNRYRENKYNNKRLFAESKDRGNTWSEPYEVVDIIDPACNGDIIRYTYGGKDILLQSLPDSPNKRERVSIYASLDNGKTFPYKYLVTEGGSAYSAMTVMDDGRVGILIEENNVDRDGFTLRFVAIPIEDIISDNNI